MNNDLNIDVRVYPLEAPKGSTVAFASVTFCADDKPVSAINSIRVVENDTGAFVAMPQTQDRNGEYNNVASPVIKGLRGKISKAVFAELDAVLNAGLPASENVPHFYFGGKLPENGTGEVSVDADITPIRNPRGNTMAFGSVTFKIDDVPFCVIDNVRVVNSAEKGLFVALPQSQDKAGKYHDIAFPVMVGLRGQMTEVVLESYEKAVSERAADRGSKFAERIAAGAQKSDEYKKEFAQKPEAAVSAAKKGAGLGD
jgi:DNA-binding cell septation regulator SpoVG